MYTLDPDYFYCVFLLIERPMKGKHLFTKYVYCQVREEKCIEKRKRPSLCTFFSKRYHCFFFILNPGAAPETNKQFLTLFS